VTESGWVFRPAGLPYREGIPFTSIMTTAIGREIHDLGHWLELDLTLHQ